MPIRNEAAFIERSLAAVLAQDYPPDRLEVIVADGLSTDGSRQIVQTLQTQHENLRLLDNPGRITSAGLNACLAQARGEILVRVDGHCEISRDYVRRCVEHLRSDGIDCVGGPLETVAETNPGQGIALAMQSPFGVGGAAFRIGAKKTMLTDTVAFPAYKRSVIEQAGPFDEEMRCNEDDEYSYRLLKLGATILLASNVRSQYYCRNNLHSLWRQYFRYGYWKVRVLQKHPRQMKLRQFIPAAFIIALFAAMALAFFFPTVRILPALVAGAYAAANVSASIWTACKGNWKQAVFLPIVFGTLHLSYGMGFLAGMARFWNHWSKISLAPAARRRVAPRWTG
jgi:cellulose synthase/poly-beta-1,6-N-acetylglucosamine synthase-like glycosyltransferase